MREDHDHAASPSESVTIVGGDIKIASSKGSGKIFDERIRPSDRKIEGSMTFEVDPDTSIGWAGEKPREITRENVYNELEKRLQHIEKLPIEDELVAVFDIRDCDAESDDIEATVENEIQISIKQDTIKKLYTRIYTEIADAVDESGLPNRLILGVPQYMRLQTWLTHIKNTSSESEFPVDDIHVVPGPMIHAINAHTSENIVHDYIREHCDADAKTSDTHTDSPTDTDTPE